MKKLKCDLCEVEISGETFEEWSAAMQAHYAEVHADAMNEMMTRPKEEGDKWMEDAKARFDTV